MNDQQPFVFRASIFMDLVHFKCCQWHEINIILYETKSHMVERSLRMR
jgi:hypothetical protein